MHVCKQVNITLPSPILEGRKGPLGHAHLVTYILYTAKIKGLCHYGANINIYQATLVPCIDGFDYSCKCTTKKHDLG